MEEADTAETVNNRIARTHDVILMLYDMGESAESGRGRVY